MNSSENNLHNNNAGISTKQKYLKTAMNLPGHFLKRSALSNVTNTSLSAPSGQMGIDKNLSNTSNINKLGKLAVTTNEVNLNNRTNVSQNKENINSATIENNTDMENRSKSHFVEKTSNDNQKINDDIEENEHENNVQLLKPSVVRATGVISQTRNIANSSKINGHSTAISELQGAIHVTKQQHNYQQINENQNNSGYGSARSSQGSEHSFFNKAEEAVGQSSIRKQPLERINETDFNNDMEGQSSRVSSAPLSLFDNPHKNSLENLKKFENTGKRPISTLMDNSDLKKFKTENGEEVFQHNPNFDSHKDMHKNQVSAKNYDSSNETGTMEDEGEEGVALVRSNSAGGRETFVFEYEWEDLDAEDANDPFMVSEYVVGIFKYLHRLELITLPKKNDLFKHPNINQNRDILVNWMVKIHSKFGLLPETLFLAINIMDRFLCRERVQLDKLQLVGTASLFIACKYEEVYSPSCKHFAHETDGACDEEEIKEGEKFILQTLNFELNYPNPMNFLRRISKADDYDIQSRTLAKYLLEISVIDFRFIGIVPSLCAAAAMFLSRKMLGKGYWDGNLIHYSGGYTKEDLESVCLMMMDYLEQPVVHDEFYKKYASRKFMKASVISRQWAKKVISQGYNVMNLHEN